MNSKCSGIGEISILVLCLDPLPGCLDAKIIYRYISIPVGIFRLGAIAATGERQKVVADARSEASSLGDDGTAHRRFGRAGRLDRAVGGLHQRTGGLGEHADVRGDHKHRVAVLQRDRHGLVQADRR